MATASTAAVTAFSARHPATVAVTSPPTAVGAITAAPATTNTTTKSHHGRIQEPEGRPRAWWRLWTLWSRRRPHRHRKRL